MYPTTIHASDRVCLFLFTNVSSYSDTVNATVTCTYGPVHKISRAVKALATLHIPADLPERSLLSDAISIKILCIGLYM